jgi:hypothetical protein
MGLGQAVVRSAFSAATARRPTTAQVDTLISELSRPKTDFPLVTEWLQRPSSSPDDIARQAAKLGVDRPIPKTFNWAQGKAGPLSRYRTLEILRTYVRDFESLTSKPMNVRTLGVRPTPEQALLIQAAADERKALALEQFKQVLETAQTARDANIEGLVAAFIRDVQVAVDGGPALRRAVRDAR